MFQLKCFSSCYRSDFSPSILHFALSAIATGLLAAVGTQVASSSFRAFAWRVLPRHSHAHPPTSSSFAETSQHFKYDSLCRLSYLKLQCSPLSHLDPPISLFCTIIFYRTYYLLINHVIYLVMLCGSFSQECGQEFLAILFPNIYQMF